MAYEIPDTALQEDRRLRYPIEVRIELVRLYRSGWNSRQAAAALGLPVAYTAQRMHLWRKRHAETAPHPEVVQLIERITAKEASKCAGPR